MTFVYAATVHLPAGAPEQAGDSLPDALTAAGGDTALLEAARASFDTGYVTAMAAAAILLALGAAVTGRLLRHHGPGTVSQLHAADH